RGGKRGSARPRRAGGGGGAHRAAELGQSAGRNQWGAAVSRRPAGLAPGRLWARQVAHRGGDARGRGYAPRHAPPAARLRARREGEFPRAAPPCRQRPAAAARRHRQSPQPGLSRHSPRPHRDRADASRRRGMLLPAARRRRGIDTRAGAAACPGTWAKGASLPLSRRPAPPRRLARRAARRGRAPPHLAQHRRQRHARTARLAAARLARRGPRRHLPLVPLGDAMTAPAPRLLYLVTEDWYFWSHRLPMAKAAQRAGFAVGVATRVAEHGERIRGEGFALHPLNWRRGSTGPLASLAAIAEIARLYRRERPRIVHHVALKPAVLGSVAALLAGVPAVVNAVTGFGF